MASRYSPNKPDMTGQFKYGRKPAVYTARSMRSALAMAAALDPLGPPPDSCRDYLSAVKTLGPRMYQNNVLADCVCADTANTLILRTANASTATVVPTDDQVISLYEVFGYVPGNPTTDNGVGELDMCNYLVNTGFLGHKATATASIEPSNLSHVKWANLLFGYCRLGLNLPTYAEDQFRDGQTWDVSNSGDPSPNGHDVPLVDFRGGMLYVYTWGVVQPMTPAAYFSWTVEAHCQIHVDWVTQQGESPSGFDLETLMQKLSFFTVADAAENRNVA